MNGIVWNKLFLKKLRIIMNQMMKNKKILKAKMKRISLKFWKKINPRNKRVTPKFKKLVSIQVKMKAQQLKKVILNRKFNLLNICTLINKAINKNNLFRVRKKN